MDNAEAIVILEEIAGLLETAHSEWFASLVRNALTSSPQTLEEFLRSNELWGGAGSIADQAFVGRSRSTQRNELEKLLIQLGRLQLRDGNANVRTRFWVEAFEKWAGGP